MTSIANFPPGGAVRSQLRFDWRESVRGNRQPLLIESIEFSCESKIRVRLLFDGDHGAENLVAFFHDPIMKFASSQSRGVEERSR
jgi:hypothetical protein